jgi:hypothetical protein
VFANNAPGAVGLALISPFHATFDLTYGIASPHYIRENFFWYPVWIGVQAVLALVLLIITLATFDRCIGRIRG